MPCIDVAPPLPVLKSSPAEYSSPVSRDSARTPRGFNPTSLQPHPQPIHRLVDRLPSWNRHYPLLNAPRLRGQSTFYAIDRPPQRVPKISFNSAARKAAVVAFGQSLVKRPQHKQSRREPRHKATMDFDLDVDRETPTQLATPSRRLSSYAGMLAPQAAGRKRGFDQVEPYPFPWHNITPSQPQPSCLPPPPPSPRTLDPALPILCTGEYHFGDPPRIRTPDREEAMFSSHDLMFPLPDPYYPDRGMVSQSEVGTATNALFEHMKSRFYPTLEASGRVEECVSRVLPPPSPRFDPQIYPPFQALAEPSLANILAAEGRNKRLQARELDAITFHHVVQMPFTNELRAHYATCDDAVGFGERRVVSVYKIHLPVPEQGRRSSFERHPLTEMWHFFEIKTTSSQYASGIPPEMGLDREVSHCTALVILAVRAEDIEESKSEECPLQKGSAQINARRREYGVKAGGRFRLEVQVREQERHTWDVVRRDLEDGSCRVFSWTEA